MSVRKLALYTDAWCSSMGGVTMAFTDMEEATCTMWFSGLPESIDVLSFGELNEHLPNVRSVTDSEFVKAMYKKAVIQCERAGKVYKVPGDHIILEESEWII